MIEASGLRHSRSADSAELVIQVEARGNRQADPAADAGIDAAILLAADLRSGRVADDAGTKLAAPQDLAGIPVDCAEVTAERAIEHQAAIGNHRAAPVRIRIRDLPHGLARQDVVLLDLAG